MSFNYGMYEMNEEYEAFRASSLRNRRIPDHRPLSTSPSKSWSFKLKKLFGFEDPDAYQPPPPVDGKKTLILDMDETLIHSADFPPHDSVEYFRSGDPQFYVYKRPGLDEFLRFCNDRFDTFIFTYGDRMYAEPVLDTLCPFIDTNHRLYRNSCELKSGNVKKDLGIFQRSKKDLILVDDSSSALHFNPKNTIMIERWFGVPNDKALIDWLPPILEQCAAADDVRDVITSRQCPKKKKPRR